MARFPFLAALSLVIGVVTPSWTAAAEDDAESVTATGWFYSELAGIDEDGNLTLTYKVGTTDTTKPGAEFTCDSEDFRVRLSTRPVDFQTVFDGRITRARSVVGTLYRDGKKVDRRRWTYLSGLSVAVPQGRNVAAKVFNAAIAQQTISFNFTSIREVTVNLPTVDDEFRKFVKKCPLV